MEIETNRITEIKQLHGQFVESLKKSLEYGIKIGALLTDQKSDLKHGQFGPWIERKLPFSRRTAQNYMKLYRERDRLKNATVAHLTEGYRLLTEPQPLEGVARIAHCYADCVNRCKEDTGCSWQTAFSRMAKETGFPLNSLLNWHSRFFGIVSDDLIPQPITEQESERVIKNIERIYLERQRELTEVEA